MKKLSWNYRKLLKKFYISLGFVVIPFLTGCMYGPAVPMYGMPPTPEYGPPAVESKVSSSVNPTDNAEK